MSAIRIQRRRTAWDVVWGVLLILLGAAILGDVFIATVVSVLFIGWFALAAGVVALVAALLRIGRGGFWATALSGGLLLVLGLMLVRHPAAGAVTLTLIAGALFLAGGITRLVAAAGASAGRGMLIFSGVVGIVLGLIVLLDIWTASFTLLGILLGIQAVADGITLVLFGRVHVDEVRSTDRDNELRAAS